MSTRLRPYRDCNHHARPETAGVNNGVVGALDFPIECPDAKNIGASLASDPSFDLSQGSSGPTDRTHPANRAKASWRRRYAAA